MRATHAINNIYKLINVFELIAYNSVHIVNLTAAVTVGCFTQETVYNGVVAVSICASLECE